MSAIIVAGAGKTYNVLKVIRAQLLLNFCNVSTRRSVTSLIGPHFVPASTTVTTGDFRPERWDLCVGILVERLPIVSSTLTQTEKQFQQYLWCLEYEKSLKSNHELRLEVDLKRAEQLKLGKVERDLDEVTNKQTAHDIEDLYNEEFNKFVMAPRLTEDDKINNLKSIDRCLNDTLYLLIEQKVGHKKEFTVPHGQRQSGENMRQAAERVLFEQCGKDITVRFLGNAPWGYCRYKYSSLKPSKDIQSKGAKLFFYRAVLQDGNATENVSHIPSYQWLKKEELLSTITNRNFLQSLQKFLL